MRREADFEEQVAGLRFARQLLALPCQPDVLAGLDAARNLDVERALAKLRAAVLCHRRDAQGQRARAAFERRLQVDRHARVMVLAAIAPRADPP